MTIKLYLSRPSHWNKKILHYSNDKIFIVTVSHISHISNIFKFWFNELLTSGSNYTIILIIFARSNLKSIWRGHVSTVHATNITFFDLTECTSLVRMPVNNMTHIYARSWISSIVAHGNSIMALTDGFLKTGADCVQWGFTFLLVWNRYKKDEYYITIDIIILYKQLYQLTWNSKLVRW